jgi:SAM-dependent methyltransferase
MVWPKQKAVLSDSDEIINEDWQEYWLSLMQQNYSAVANFNHQYVINAGKNLGGQILEVGAGGGEHIELERRAGTPLDNYRVLELRPAFAKTVRARFPSVEVMTGDCQREIPVASKSIHRVIAIHVMEHLENLPNFLREASRILHPVEGRLLAVIPCEGGLGYSLGRRVTSQRLFEKRYRKPYHSIIAAEHLNTAHEILSEIPSYFRIDSSQWWPLYVPNIHLNLCVGLSLAPLKSNEYQPECSRAANLAKE